MPPDALSALRQMLSGLPDDAWDDLKTIWQPMTAKRKTILTSPGQVEKYLYFVVEGAQRAYVVDVEGRDSTMVFTYPYSFAGNADSFLVQRSSLTFFETLTASTFLRTTWHQLDELMLKHHALERIIRILVSETLAGVLKRQAELQSMSAEQRFRTFVARSPHLLNMVPHKHIASYLRIDPTNFSKYLGSIRIDSIDEGF